MPDIAWITCHAVDMSSMMHEKVLKCTSTQAELAEQLPAILEAKPVDEGD